MISAPEPACDLVDMELCALAMIAKREHIPLKYFNFISDNADDSSHQDWKKPSRCSVRISQYTG